jgi:hypothetical protein
MAIGSFAIDAFATYAFPAWPTIYQHPQWFQGWRDADNNSHYDLCKCDNLIAAWQPLSYRDELSPWEIGFLSGVKYRRMQLLKQAREAMANY